MKIAIAGYGNLGKSLEQVAKICGDEVVAVFSRRKLTHPLWASYAEAEKFVGKIDVVMLAMGSYGDIEENFRYFKEFDTVDSFDTHAKIDEYKARLNEVKPNTISLCCVGWDPGVLSVARGIFGTGGGEIATYWGPGISQGHSNALRQIDGVIDAVQITEPKKDALKKARAGKNVDALSRHRRLCYVACDKGEENRIAQEIVNMPNYFCGQEVQIEFCSAEKIAKLKGATEHSGEVIACGDGFTADARLKVDSNTEYTARVMLRYARAVPQLKQDGYLGALDPFDVPLKYVASSNLI